MLICFESESRTTENLEWEFKIEETWLIPITNSPTMFVHWHEKKSITRTKK